MKNDKKKKEEKLATVIEPSFQYNLEFNDIDIMYSDSLYYELEFDMIGMDALDMLIKIDDSLYDSIIIADIDSSTEILISSLILRTVPSQLGLK